MAYSSKMRALLKKRGVTQHAVASILGLRDAEFSLKARGFNDNERRQIIEMLDLTEDEVIDVFGTLEVDVLDTENERGEDE